MKIKAKLTLGVGLLFLLIIFQALLSTYYIRELNKDIQNILEANYNTLDYTRNMLNSLDDDFTNIEIQQQFLINLEKQQSNISEIGEQELTDKLTRDFNKLQITPSDDKLKITIRKDLIDIMTLNMQAIERKSNVAKLSATSALWWIPLIGTLCFMIAFILLVNLPGNIANPVSELTKSIRQIAARNYKERVDFESHNEFGEVAKAFNVMARKLEEYDNSKLAKLLIEKKRIETLIGNMRDPVIGLDENLSILFVNDEACKVTGLKAEDLIGFNAKDIALQNDLIRMLLKDISTTDQNRKINRDEPIKIFTNKRESYFEKNIIDISITPTGENATRQIGYVIVLKNITSFKEKDFAKTNFIATVSHEFKTPISSIQMSLQLLENKQIGDLNEEQKNLLDSIKEDTNRLLKITRELLDMTQAESGNMHLSLMPVYPEKIVNDAILATRTEAEQKHIILEFNHKDPLPRILADSEKTVWVLTNIISNAIRHSYENSVVTIDLSTNNGQVKFSVKDTGQGIASQYKTKIFDRYFRIPGTLREGTGLGLAISKEFIESQGGNIEVESELGMGSIFTISLNKVNS